MKHVVRLIVAGVISLPFLGYAKTAPDPKPFIDSFYRTYLTGKGKLTPELLNKLSPFTAKNLKTWQQCQAGNKDACSVDCIDAVCYYDGTMIPERLDYFTLTEKVEPHWATQIKQEIVRDDKDGFYTVKVRLAEGPWLYVDVVYDNNKWHLLSVAETIEVDPALDAIDDSEV